MTGADRMAFAQTFNRLAVATRLPSAEVETALRVYFEGLADLSVEAVVEAGDHLADTADWFPKLAEWRRATREVTRRETRQTLLTGDVTHAEPTIHPKDLQEAVYDYLNMRGAGVPREDAVKGFEGMVRAFIIPGREAEWHHECEACEDSGWELRTCYPDQGPVCGVRKCKRAAEHTYAVACACRETNRTYQRKRAAGW